MQRPALISKANSFPKRSTAVGVNIPKPNSARASAVRSLRPSPANSLSKPPQTSYNASPTQRLRQSLVQTALERPIHKKSRSLNMRFSIATVGNSQQPSLASFSSPRAARLQSPTDEVTVDHQLRALIVPYVRNLTKESFKSTVEQSRTTGSSQAAPPSRRPLAIEGRSLFVEEEARKLSNLIGSASRPSSGSFSPAPSSPATQRVRKDGFFSMDPRELDSQLGDEDSTEAAAVKFTGLAIRSEPLTISTTPSTGLSTQHGSYEGSHAAVCSKKVKHHIFIPVVRELK